MAKRDSDSDSLSTDCEADGFPTLLDDSTLYSYLQSYDISQIGTSGKRKAVSDSSSSSNDSDGSISDPDISSPEQSDEESTGTEVESPAEQIKSQSSSLSNEEQIAYNLENLFLGDTGNNDEELGAFDDDEDVRKDFDGDTKLHLAFIFMAYSYIRCMLKSKKIARYLNVQNNLFQTALHLAVEKTVKAPVDMINDLLRAGADPTIQDNKGRTFLHIICENGDYQTLPALYFMRQEGEEGRRIVWENIVQCLNMQSYDGITCLHIAVKKRSIPIVKMLLYLGADANIKDRKSGRTALHFAAEAGYIDIVKILVDHPGVIFGKETYKGETPLILAYHRKHDCVVQLLVNNGDICNLHEVKMFGPIRQKFRKTTN